MPHVDHLAEIEANELNLNSSRYVDTSIEAERVDVAIVLERERDEAVAGMNELLAEMGYA